MSITDPAAPSTRRRTTRRHRRGKAIVAVAAGTALMLGGAGTYAFWSTSEALQATAVSSGNLDLSLGTSEWTLKGIVGSVRDVTDLADVRIVPGDVLTLTQVVDVTLEGDTLVADLAAVVGSDFATGALGAHLDVDLSISSYGAQTGTNTYRLTEANNGPATAVLTITFDPDVEQTTGANASVDLDEIAFTLTQASS